MPTHPQQASIAAPAAPAARRASRSASQRALQLADQVAQLPVWQAIWQVHALGLADAGGALAAMRPQQWRATLDVGGWHRQAPDLAAMGAYLAARGEQEGDDPQLAVGFAQLDEELQTLWLGRTLWIEPVAEEEAGEGAGLRGSRHGDLAPPDGAPAAPLAPDAEADGDDGAPPPAWQHSPDHTFWLAPRPSASQHPVDPLLLVDALYQADAAHARRLLTAARWELPAQLAEEAGHFRAGRLEELGLCDRATAMARLLAPPDRAQLATARARVAALAGPPPAALSAAASDGQQRGQDEAQAAGPAGPLGPAGGRDRHPVWLALRRLPAGSARQAAEADLWRLALAYAVAMDLPLAEPSSLAEALATVVDTVGLGLAQVGATDADGLHIWLQQLPVPAAFALGQRRRQPLARRALRLLGHPRVAARRAADLAAGDVAALLEVPEGARGAQQAPTSDQLALLAMLAAWQPRPLDAEPQLAAAAPPAMPLAQLQHPDALEHLSERLEQVAAALGPM